MTSSTANVSMFQTETKPKLSAVNSKELLVVVAIADITVFAIFDCIISNPNTKQFANNVVGNHNTISQTQTDRIRLKAMATCYSY